MNLELPGVSLTKAGLGLGAAGLLMIAYARHEANQATAENRGCDLCHKHVAWGTYAIGFGALLVVIDAIVDGRP